MDSIILIGYGGHTKACIDVIEVEGKYKITGLIGEVGSHEIETLDIPIIGTDNDLENLRKKFSNALITIGQIKSPEIRIRLYNVLKNLNYRLPNIVSSKAYISKHAAIGEGTIVMHGAIVNANAKIGKNCIINSRSLIEHDVVIGDHCHIATGAVINGEVSVGSETFIGSGTITKQSITIGSHCVIGAGILLKSDVASNRIVKH